MFCYLSIYSVNLAEKNDKEAKNPEYINHTTVGHQNHDITFKKLPMYSFPKGENKKSKGKAIIKRLRLVCFL